MYPTLHLMPTRISSNPPCDPHKDKRLWKRMDQFNRTPVPEPPCTQSVQLNNRMHFECFLKFFEIKERRSVFYTDTDSDSLDCSDLLWNSSETFLHQTKPVCPVLPAK